MTSVLRKPEFRTNAAVAYGKSWQWRLAVAHGLNLRTVQNWAKPDDKPIPEDIYRHVTGQKSIIDDQHVEHRIAVLVGQLKALGLEDHVIAAQLHAAADKLSPPDLKPRDVVTKVKV